MSWHRVQHTPSTASSQDQQVPAPSQFLNSRRMLLYSTLSIPTITSCQRNRVSAAVAFPSKLTTSKYCSNLARSYPATASPNMLDQRLRVHHWVHSISSCKCMSKLARSRSPSGSLHQHNLDRSGSHTQTSQTIRATSLLLLSTSRCFQTRLELSKVLSHSARAFSGASESTCSYGDAFRMLHDLTYRMVKFWSSWDLSTDLWEAARAAETAA